MSLKIFQTRVGLGTAFELQEKREEEEDITHTSHILLPELCVCMLHQHQLNKQEYPYCALVWFFPSMPAHVDHQHVLCLEGLLLSRAFLPPTYELLLLPVDVVIVDVLEKKMREL